MCILAVSMDNKKNKRRGKINLWAGRTSTVFSITLVLFVFGLLLFVEYHSYKATHTVQERIAYQVNLKPDASEEEALALLEDLKDLDYVKNADYISKDEAVRLFSEDIEEDIMDVTDGENPLYATIMVTLNASNSSKQMTESRERFEEDVDEYAIVDNVSYQENMVNDLSVIFYKLSWFLVVFVVLLLIVSVALISTTIKIAINNNRYTIQTMSMVGAKMSFITRPFLWRSLLYGFLGALFALVMMFGAIYVFNKQFHLAIFHPRYFNGYIVLVVAVFLVGMTISFIATYFSVHAHLRNRDQFN